MMDFNPANLKDDVLAALDCFSFINGDIEDIHFEKFLDIECYADYDVVITENSKVCFYFIEGDEYTKTTVRFMLNAYASWKDSKLNEQQSYAKSKKELYFLLNILDYDTIMILDSLRNSANPIVKHTPEGTELWCNQLTINNSLYNVSLFNGVCIYHLLVEESGNFDKYLPSYSTEDYFVRVTSEDDIDHEVADSLAESFAFELQATHNLMICFSGGRTNPVDTFYDVDEMAEHPFRIFPLLYGRGIKDLLKIYYTAKMTLDTDYKILGFTKVIEYISPTIIHEELFERVRHKLTLPAVFAPTSEFISELGEIYKKHQGDINKDSELIKLAVSMAIELNDIWDDLPAYIKPKNAEYIETIDDSLRETSIESLAVAIYDTRNEIAHAKANYEKKGKECPLKHREQFSHVLDVIAVRCIRWFAMQPEEKRVVLS